MLVIIGSIVVIVCVIGGFIAHGGNIFVLWQPEEFIIIVGASAGAFLIGNSKAVISHSAEALKAVIKGSIYSKADYIELLSVQYTIFRLMKTKGMLELESHIENPKESKLFSTFPGFLTKHHALTFLCDYLRMLTMGTENANQLEDLMNLEIELHGHERGELSVAFQNVADGLPALGIVAAVLGVINTMGSIDQPPAVLGHLIGGALVGTFTGVLLSYGFVGPFAHSIHSVYAEEVKYLGCIKTGILACMNGYAPAVSVEFARKAIDSELRPDFYELEQAIANLKAASQQ